MNRRRATYRPVARSPLFYLLGWMIIAELALAGSLALLMSLHPGSAR